MRRDFAALRCHSDCIRQVIMTVGELLLTVSNLRDEAASLRELAKTGTPVVITPTLIQRIAEVLSQEANVLLALIPKNAQAELATVDLARSSH